MVVLPHSRAIRHVRSRLIRGLFSGLRGCENSSRPSRYLRVPALRLDPASAGLHAARRRNLIASTSRRGRRAAGRCYILCGVSTSTFIPSTRRTRWNTLKSTHTQLHTHSPFLCISHFKSLTHAHPSSTLCIFTCIVMITMTNVLLLTTPTLLGRRACIRMFYYLLLSPDKNHHRRGGWGLAELEVTRPGTCSLWSASLCPCVFVFVFLQARRRFPLII